MITVAADAKMYAKGYRYRLTPLTAYFDPLYVKTIKDAGQVMRDDPKNRYQIDKLYEDGRRIS